VRGGNDVNVTLRVPSPPNTCTAGDSHRGLGLGSDYSDSGQITAARVSTSSSSFLTEDIWLSSDHGLRESMITGLSHTVVRLR